ncbi:MAG: hypothetical protein R2991_09065 [Thermoanaerobaculia bacterium]
MRSIAVAAMLGIWAIAPALRAQPDAFDWTLGTWEGVRRDGVTGTAEPLRMTVESVLGGTGFLRRLEVAGEHGVYRGLSVQVYDGERDRWLWQYTSEGRGWFAEYAADEVDGARSVWTPTEPRVRDSRLTSELEDGGLWRRTMEVSDDGETWRVLWVDELRPAVGD